MTIGYGFSGDERNRLRGIRVHDFVENDVTAYVSDFATYFKRAGDDYGMCLAPDPEDCLGDPYYPWTPTGDESTVMMSTQLSGSLDGTTAGQDVVLDPKKERKKQADRSVRAVGDIAL
jgi:hypothetical protein